MQKLPIKQDNTTQSPVGMSVGCLCKQTEPEQGNICRLRLVSVFMMETPFWMALLIAYLIF